MNDYNFRRVFRSLPTLKTARLTLRKISFNDAEDMYTYASLNTVTRFLLWEPHLNIEETRGYIEYVNKRYKKGTYADWGISLNSENTFIGTVGFADINYEENIAEIGYVLNPSYHGKGYMTEAVSAVLKIAFEDIGFDKVVLRIIDENAASIRLALRLGFTLPENGNKQLEIKGIQRTVCHYELKKENYKK